MATHPNIQRKAQEEIDRVVGSDRLPDFADEALLLYVQALSREVSRWRPVVPLGLFHATSSDDVYDGNYIPAGER